MENNLTPIPANEPLLMSFPDALKELINGKTITRFSFDPKEDCYGLLVDGWLTIHLNGGFHRWTVNDGDLLAVDWMVRE